MRTGQNNHSIRIFTEDDIERITNNYSTPIGKGGFGEVFRGVLDDEDDVVAVKRCIHEDLTPYFMEEIRIHAQISHKNVVKLIGYCTGENTVVMVTEFISNGNLEDALHNSDISIPLVTRLGIAIGCAEALSYMHWKHLSSDSIVCHGDIKPANVLLGTNFTAKVSDFGLSRCLSGGITQFTSLVKGSIGYMDPIYAQKGCVTPKSDVYSFGAILMELVARKRVIEGKVGLIDNFRVAFAEGKGLSQLFDAEITERSNTNILVEIAKLAVECLTLDINKRPKMTVVTERLVMLWKALHGREGNIIGRLLWTALGNSTSSVLDYLAISRKNDTVNELITKHGNVRIFRRGELRKITENYSSELVRGSFYNVYKGTLEDNTLVAVKKYFDGHDQNDEIWQKEFGSPRVMSVLYRIVHKNIIKLLGFCMEDNFPILIYEYAARNLSDVLHGKEDFPLELRLKIAAKTARALESLHSPGIAIRHGDVMPSNILLDDSFMPKVAGFTSSRIVTKDCTERMHVLTGNRNYMDPYYRHTGVVTVKSDVYSFGVLLLELITRKQPSGGRPEKYGPVAEFSRVYEREKSAKSMFDEGITAEGNIPVLEEIGKLAQHCISLEWKKGLMTMKQVAERLEMIRRWHSGHGGYKMLGEPKGKTVVSPWTMFVN